jgi:hypothetical protein
MRLWPIGNPTVDSPQLPWLSTRILTWSTIVRVAHSVAPMKATLERSRDVSENGTSGLEMRRPTFRTADRKISSLGNKLRSPPPSSHRHTVYSLKRNKEGMGLGLRGISGDAFYGHTAVGGGHKGNCKRSSYRTELGAPKLSGNSDKTSGNYSQYRDHGGKGAEPHLLKRTSQARGTEAFVISLLASMVPTRKRFPTYKITGVPTVFVYRIFLNLFLSLPFDHSKRCERAADSVALVFTASTQRGTWPIAGDLCGRPAPVAVTLYVLRGGATSARTDYLDSARRTRPSVTQRGAGVRATIKWLQAE